MTITKQSVEILADDMGYLPAKGATLFASLDGSDVADYLTSLGFEIDLFADADLYGVAITKCGIAVSTNGYVHRVGGFGPPHCVGK